MIPKMHGWLVLYDGDCGLCKWMLARILGHDRANRLRPINLKSDAAAGLLADLTPEQQLDSWHLIAPTGERYSAGAALPPLLRLLPGGALPAAIAAASPGLTERCYRWVAEHRSLLSKLIPATSKRKASELVGRRESGS
jgi:predicted DCC family thiol-disulfide oxidoreductase YuxK